MVELPSKKKDGNPLNNTHTKKEQRKREERKKKKKEGLGLAKNL